MKAPIGWEGTMHLLTDCAQGGEGGACRGRRGVGSTPARLVLSTVCPVAALMTAASRYSGGNYPPLRKIK